MKAFHGDPEVKEKYVGRVQAHRKADQIVQGQYWEDGKGCAVGCTIHGSDHQAYETELGIPVQLAHLQDCIFEDLPNEEAKDFPVDFLESIPVGADLKLVLHQFLYWLLVDPQDGVIQYAQGEGEKQMKEAILSVADLHNRVIKGQEVKNEQWIAARDAATAATEATSEAAWAASLASSAAARAATSYVASVGVRAVQEASWATGDAASHAASAAVRAASSHAVRATVVKRQKKKLLELLAGESVLQ